MEYQIKLGAVVGVYLRRIDPAHHKARTRKTRYVPVHEARAIFRGVRVNVTSAQQKQTRYLINACV